MSAQPIPRISEEQYLEADRGAEFKSEYYNGRMYAMAGVSYAHFLIVMNFGSQLHQALRMRPCTIGASDLRLRVSPGGLCTYPDIMVICGEPRLADDRNDTLMNPTVIVEVLSKSTEAHDRGFKFAQYRTLDSLREYVLVSQSEPRVEKYQRQNTGQWVLSDYVGLDAVAGFDSIQCEVPLPEIYAKVTFAAEDAPGNSDRGH